MRKSVLLVLVLCMAMLTVGCGTTPAPSDPKQQGQLQEDGNAAVETILGAGEWYVGEDIPPGRYVITPPDDQSGNIAIYDNEKSSSDVNEILNPFGTQGVKSLTYTLKDEQIIKIESMDAVLFTPKED